MNVENTHKITATVLGVGKVQSFGANGFQVRKIWLDVTEKAEWPKQTEIEFHQNNVALLDGLEKGDVVTITFSLEGNKWEKDGKSGFFPKARGRRIDRATPAPAPAEVVTPTVINDDDDLPF